MSDAKSPPELSMDEILATIRRIIAEDEQPGRPSTGSGTGAGPAASGSAATGATVGGAAGGAPAGPADRGGTPSLSADPDEIFELTEALNEDGSVRHLIPIGGTPRIAVLREPAAPAEPEPELAPSRADAPRVPAMPGEASAPEPAGTPEPAGKLDERPIADEAPPAAAAALLGSAPREPQAERGLLLGAGDRTLEDMVRDLLRPLLESWLDEHLPEIVERLMQAEIARAGKPGPG